MFCISCGTHLPTGAGFCFQCGAKQERATNQPPPPPVQHSRVERRDITLVAVTCPVCGGPIADSDGRCGYCGSVVVIKMDMPRINPDSLKLAVIDKHIHEYRQAVRRDPNDETAHYGLGVAYYNLRLHDEAITQIEEAVRLMPENPNIQYQLAVMYAGQMTPFSYGQNHDHHGSQALKRVNRALTIRPSMIEAVLLKAALCSHPKYFNYESVMIPAGADLLVSAHKLWEIAWKLDPDSIREPVSAFLRMPQINRRGLPPIELGEAILSRAPQFQVKKKKFGSNAAEELAVQRELYQFYRGQVEESARLLAAAKFVMDVIKARALNPLMRTS